jgi:hypothetical protein
LNISAVINQGTAPVKLYWSDNREDY